MSLLYLIRHGQAGSRQDYDVLSPLGREQAKRLGTHFAAHGPRFGSLISGGCRRQLETAEVVALHLHRKGGPGPEIVADPRWNEFPLERIYEHYAPRMVREDPGFARDYAEMEKELLVDPHNTRGATGRCDAAVVRAWIGRRYPEYPVPSWREFRAGVRAALSDLLSANDEGNVALFTSAGPIGVAIGTILELSEEKTLWLLAVQYNTGVSVTKILPSGAVMMSFNEVPHLPGPDSRTFR